MTLQTCDLNCAAVQPCICAWPVRISRALLAAAVSSVWPAKNRIAVCRIAKTKATKGAARRLNSTVVDALSCEMKRRGNDGADNRNARALIALFSDLNMVAITPYNAIRHALMTLLWIKAAVRNIDPVATRSGRESGRITLRGEVP